MTAVRRILHFVGLPVALALLLAPALARAAAGDLDASFGHGGLESLRFASDVSGPIDTALQPDGKILVSLALDDTRAATRASNFGVARLQPGGALDSSFDDHGTVTPLIHDRAGLQFSFVSALAVQPDGRVVAVGLAGNHQGHTALALARYLVQ